MVEMVEVVMVAPGEAILEIEAISVIPVDVVIPEDLPPVVTVKGVHRIVRVVLVRPVGVLKPCLRKK